MIPTKALVHATLALGAMSLLSGFAGCLALTDIYHGEADLTLEWHIVQVAVLVFLVFLGSTMLTLKRVLQAIS